AVLDLVALQVPPRGTKSDAKPKEPPQSPPRRGGLILPRSITTEVQLEDVELTQILARVEAMGLHLPFPAAGRLSLNAKLTIPLGKLRDLKAYTIQGDATLASAHIAGIDFGHLMARVDLKDGVLELQHLKGRLVDQPGGGITQRPEPTEPLPDEGPLPPGGFRAQLRAELSPPGRLTARFEGDELPLGELAAPALPHPTPLSGLVTLNATAEADVGALADPKTWAASGRIESRRISYRETTLDAVSTAFTVKEGRLEVADLSAQLAGKPLSGRLGVALARPFDFDAQLDVNGWDLSDLLAFVPSVPRPSPIDGTLSVQAEAKGTLAPLVLDTHGEGRIAQFQAGPVPLGEVPFRWTTEGDTIALTGIEAHPFGGRLRAEAKIPARGTGPIEGTATFSAIDTAALVAALPGGGLAISGKADGQLGFIVDPAAMPEAAPLRVNVKLSAPDLTVQGIPAQDVTAAVKVRDGVLSYDLLAESLGGKVRLRGDVPLRAEPAEANAEVQAVGFTLTNLWRALGLKGALANLRGLAALDANVRTSLAAADLRAQGIAEIRDLRWGPDYPLGRLRGIVALMPAGWRVEPLTGELWGGEARGAFWGETPARGRRRYGFALEIDRALLTRVAEFDPTLAPHLTGLAALRLAGRFDEVLRARGVVLIRQATVYGLPLTELRAPAEIVYTPAADLGTVESRHWIGRLAGGRVSGDAEFHFGRDRSYRGDVQLRQIDLATIVRRETEVRRPASGKLSGTIHVSGPDPDDLRRMRGRTVIDLDDASLGDLPVIRALNRFLGSAQGGLFEDGDLQGSIANAQLVVEPLTLVGRTMQLHATGTIGFDGRLNLEALVNTNQIISETGQALLARIPGLAEASGRGGRATLAVANFLSNRLLKVRITGTLRDPSVQIDPTIVVTSAAVGFFSSVFRLPLGLIR
ncbi:MAG: hypothetical protein IRY99_14675, partial [Isosphaeraceae bacterium]|nr:hypothetical protein [Isosphaeraceae bacterium]